MNPLLEKLGGMATTKGSRVAPQEAPSQKGGGETMKQEVRVTRLIWECKECGERAILFAESADEAVYKCHYCQAIFSIRKEEKDV